MGVRGDVENVGGRVTKLAKYASEVREAEVERRAVELACAN